jgi:hypothetical protein
MKGQNTTFAMVAVLPVILISMLITFWVYGSVSNITPHDQTIDNESICTTCVNGTEYSFDNTPVLNDTTMICYNNSADLMTNGIVDGTCLGYNINSYQTVNITNTSGDNACQISNVVCTYTYDWANANEGGFWNTATSNINSGYTLGSVSPIIFAAVIIIGVVILLGKE